MPLRDDILAPIPGDNPSGANLRYAPIYDKIKEARREEEDIVQGDWARERKVADWTLTIKLISEALATKTKDLQLAAWLTEALLRKEGIGGLQEGLALLRGMVEQFWETVYPELEDGDAEFRAAPLEWVGERLEKAVKNVPLTRNKLDWFQYKESRAVGYEEAADTEEKQAARAQAITDKKVTGEVFDAGFNGTPKQFYVDLEGAYDATLESLQSLAASCDEKFGDFSPNFGKLREVLEEVRQTVHILLNKKREKEPDAPAPGEEPVWEETPAAAEESWSAAADSGAGYAAAAPARAPARRMTAGPEPADREDAAARVIAVARYLRRENPYSPAPHLMLRGLRWGELRAAGESIDASLLEAPPTDVRQEIKRLAGESLWAELMEAVETAMGEPYGRGWLDLQRYAWRSCYEQGSYFDAISKAIRSGVRSLLADYPALPGMTLADDTPTANVETVAWIKEHVGTESSPAAAADVWAAPAAYAQPEGGEAERPPDPFEIAMQAVRAGDINEAFAILTRELGQESSARGRFQRKAQLAQVSIAAGHHAVAYPILKELEAEIDRRGLADWEPPDALARTLVLLYRSMAKVEGVTGEERQKLYARICCLDPVQALACGR
jgi:type VI secretion system protein ImpA